MSELSDALRELERSNGRLMPEDVVEAARAPTSPLHSQFEWDDGEAARKYRLAQAALLIRRVKVEVTVNHLPLRVAGYVSDPARPVGGGYRNTITIRSDEEAARAVIVDEMARVAAAVRRAKTLAAVLGVAEDIDHIETLAASITARALAPESVGGH